MASAQAQAVAATRTHLTLKGSTALVHEFFNYSVQSILYQRNIYPAEDFKTVKKYGLQMLVTTDDGLADYLEKALGQLQLWLERGDVTRLVVVIVEKETGETRERWQFDVEVVNQGTDEQEAQPPAATDASVPKKMPGKTDAQVRAEIAAIIKQITASCTFLPVLDEPCKSSLPITRFHTLRADMVATRCVSDSGVYKCQHRRASGMDRQRRTPNSRRSSRTGPSTQLLNSRTSRRCHGRLPSRRRRRLNDCYTHSLSHIAKHALRKRGNISPARLVRDVRCCFASCCAVG